MPLRLIDRQYIDFRGEYEGGLRDLFEVLKKRLGTRDRHTSEIDRMLGSGVRFRLLGNLDQANVVISQALALSPSIAETPLAFWDRLSGFSAAEFRSGSLSTKYRPQLKIAERTKYVGRYSDGKDQYQWTIWLAVPKKVLSDVEYVRYTLHETFSEPVQIVRNREDKFSLTRQGWGTFDIPVEVHFRDGSAALLSYDLTFKGA